MATEPGGWRGGHVLAAFVAGAALGAIAALLTAPQAGAKTRDKVRAAARAAGRKARGVPDELHGAWRRAIDAARAAFEDALDRD